MFLLFLLKFYYIKCVFHDFMVKIAIIWNKIVEICKYKANNIIVFGPIRLNICQLYNIEDYNICINIKINFKILKIRNNILFGKRQKLIVNWKKWVILIRQITLKFKNLSYNLIYSIIKVSYSINFNYITLG